MQLTSATYTWNAAGTFGFYTTKLISFSPCPAEQATWKKMAGQADLRYNFCSSSTAKNISTVCPPHLRPRKGNERARNWEMDHATNLFWRQVLHTGA